MNTQAIRVWDRINRRMLNGDSQSLNVYHTPGHKITYVLWLNEETGRWETINEFDIMESTERHDRTGREIYESDIVTTNSGRRLVYWDKTECAYMLRGGGDGVSSFASMQEEGMRIDGNLHEHPELFDE